jgi:hypothetical protein
MIEVAIDAMNYALELDGVTYTPRQQESGAVPQPVEETRTGD